MCFAPFPSTSLISHPVPSSPIAQGLCFYRRSCFSRVQQGAVWQAPAWRSYWGPLLQDCTTSRSRSPCVDVVIEQVILDYAMTDVRYRSSASFTLRTHCAVLFLESRHNATQDDMNQLEGPARNLWTAAWSITWAADSTTKEIRSAYRPLHTTRLKPAGSSFTCKRDKPPLGFGEAPFTREHRLNTVLVLRRRPTPCSHYSCSGTQSEACHHWAY